MRTICRSSSGPRNISAPAKFSRSCRRCASPSLRAARLRAVPRAAPPKSLAFLYFLDFGGFPMVGSSPEILVRVRDGKVTIRPHRRHAAARRRRQKRTRHSATELLADPKERAEHLMLLDLGRNDVGRVAEIGSVKVTEQIRDRALQPRDAYLLECRKTGSMPRYDAIDALSAGFPAGTLSGAPKVRAMEIIDELETGAAQSLWRRDRLFRGRRQHRYLHRAAHRRGQGRHDDRAGGLRRRRRGSNPAAERQEIRRQGAAPCSAPPRKPCASRRGRNAGNKMKYLRGKMPPHV